MSDSAIASTGWATEASGSSADAGPKLRRSIQAGCAWPGANGVWRRVVQDALLRGAGRPGFSLGHGAEQLLDLLDGRPTDELLRAGRERLSADLGTSELTRFLERLDRLWLLESSTAMARLVEAHRRELRRGYRPAILPALGGYDAAPRRLHGRLAGLLEAGARRRRTDAEAPRAVVAPHASLDTSGVCAGAAYSLLRESRAPRTVLVVGPNHLLPGLDTIDVSNVVFASPLGEIAADGELAEQLLAALPTPRQNGLAQFREHSVEMQLPWLQHLAGSAWPRVPRLVSVIISCPRLPDGRFCPSEEQLRQLEALAAGIATAMQDPEVALVVTGDLTHYGPHYRHEPFVNSPPERLLTRIRESDDRALGALLALDGDGLLEALRNLLWCGSASFYVLLRVACRRGWQPMLVDYLGPPEIGLIDGHLTSFAALAFLESPR